MTDIENRLKIVATEHVAQAFRSVSQQVAQLEHNVTRSNRKIHESGQTVLGQMEEMGTRGFTSINRLTGGFAGLGLKVLGVAAAAETLMDSFTDFAKREEQIVRASNALGVSVKEVTEAYEKAETAARKFGIAPEDARKGVDALNTALGGIDKAGPQYELLIRTTAALGTTTEETAAIIKSASNDLKIPAQDLAAFFDKIFKGAEGGALKAKGLAQTLAVVGQQASALYGGQVGPRAQGQLIGLAEAIAKSAKEEEVPSRIEEFLDIQGGRRPEMQFKRETNINLGLEAQRAARKRKLDIAAGREGQDPLESFLDTVQRGRMILHRQKPDIPLDQLTNRLFLSPTMRRTVNDMLAERERIKAARERPAEEEAGAVAKAAEKDVATTAAKVRTAKGYIEKGKEVLGGFTAHPIESLMPGEQKSTFTPSVRDNSGNVIAPQTGAAPSHKKTWGEWFSQFNPISAAGAAEAPHGGFPSLPSAARPLIPSQPGSATERTAREQLEAIRRLERIHMWGGGLGGGLGSWGGSSGAAPGGVTPGHAGGGGGSPRAAHSARRAVFGHPGKGGGHVSPGGGKGGGGTPNQYFTKENADAIRESAARLGTTPEDLATVIGYETGGTFSPSKWGGAGGRYMGLIQFGPPERAQYGANDKQSFKEQMGAVERYLKGRGFKPGMGLEDLYSTILAGSPGHSNRRDSGGSGYEHVARMKGAMAARARRFLGSGGSSGGESASSVIKGQGDPHKPGFDASSVPFHRTPEMPDQHSQLEDLRRQAAETVRVKVAYDFDAADVRTHSRAYARRSFNKEARDARYSSYTDMGTPA